MSKISLIIDCDPGVDDALAIIMANTKACLDIKAITSVAGNVGIEYTTHNLQLLASLLDLKCPIAKGEEGPLVKQQVTASNTHGKDGFGGYAHLLGNIALRELSDLSAVELMAKILSESEEKITIAAVGPLTNIAVLIKAYPKLIHKIERLSIMGGGLHYGNITATAEFNFYVDPEAAQIVFRSGIPITLASLDVTLQAGIYSKDINYFKQIHNEIAVLASKILESYASKDAALHDPVAILALCHPEMFESEDLLLQVETNEGATRGMSYADCRERSAHLTNCKFLTKIKRDEFIEEIAEALRYYTKASCIKR